MTALLRYRLDGLLRSQRWVPPTVLYAIFLGLVFASGAGPSVPAFGATGTALLPVAAWLTRIVCGLDDVTSGQVTAVAVGGRVRMRVADVLASLLACSAFAVVAVCWAAVNNHSRDGHGVHDLRAFLGGLAVHGVFAVTGVGLGAVASLLDPGPSTILIVTGMVVGLAIPFCPLASFLTVLERNRVHGFAPVAVSHGAGLLALAVVLHLGAATAAAHRDRYC